MASLVQSLKKLGPNQRAQPMHNAAAGSISSRRKAIGSPHSAHQPNSPWPIRFKAISIRAISLVRLRASAWAISCCCIASMRESRPTLCWSSSTVVRQLVASRSSAFKSACFLIKLPRSASICAGERSSATIISAASDNPAPQLSSLRCRASRIREAQS